MNEFVDIIIIYFVFRVIIAFLGVTIPKIS